MSKAEKLLQRMRQSKKGWKAKDFETLYLGFGFEKHEGGKHTHYIHPRYTDLIATVGRHNELATGYAQTAVQLIAELLEREQK